MRRSGSRLQGGEACASAPPARYLRSAAPARASVTVTGATDCVSDCAVLTVQSSCGADGTDTVGLRYVLTETGEIAGRGEARCPEF